MSKILFIDFDISEGNTIIHALGVDDGQYLGQYELTGIITKGQHIRHLQMKHRASKVIINTENYALVKKHFPKLIEFFNEGDKGFFVRYEGKDLIRAAQ